MGLIREGWVAVETACRGIQYFDIRDQAGSPQYVARLLSSLYRMQLGSSPQANQHQRTATQRSIKQANFKHQLLSKPDIDAHAKEGVIAVGLLVGDVQEIGMLLAPASALLAPATAVLQLAR